MAKTPITRDRFKIVCEVEAADMGPIIAQLTRMGMANVGFELITDVVTFNKNGPRVVHELKAEDFLTPWVAEHPTFRAAEAVQHFEANNRNAGACYSALKKMVEDGALKKLGPGNYQRADVKALAAPRHSDVTGEEIILAFAKKHHGRFNTKQIKELFTQEGRAVNSVYSTCDALLKDKMIKRIGAGEYVLLAKGRAKAVEKKPKQKAAPPLEDVAAAAPAPHLNGGSHHAPMEAMTNG
jgi:hypothetical protein